MGWSLDLHELALARGGVFDRDDALARGVPSSAIDQEHRTGRLVSMHPGVYRPAGVSPNLLVRQRAALLAGGPDSALSHRSAGVLNALLRLPDHDRVDLLVPHHQRARLDGVDTHRSMRMPPTHLRIVDDLRVTSVDRTLADLGAVVDRIAVARAVERAVIDRLTTIDRLYRFVDDHGARGRTGIGSLRSALDDWMLSGRPPDSALEVVFARLVRRSGLPAPVHQYEIRDGRRLVARVDAAWPPQRLVVEVDGYHHHSTASAFRRDLARQNEIVRLGWQILRFDWLRVVRRPSGVVADLRSVLDRAA